MLPSKLGEGGSHSKERDMIGYRRQGVGPPLLADSEPSGRGAGDL